jgi:DNA-binding transcriptional LysR family regulator
MYNHLLDTFIAVADFGSFTKAAEYLYISPTAVMKQINTLESHLNLKLINRTPSGVNLTTSGEVIYQEGKFMIEYSQQALSKAKAALYEYETTFCVGTSLLNPAKPFMDLWYKINKDFPNYKLHLVPYEDNFQGILNEIALLGEKFDFLIGVCDSKAWLSRCNFVELGRFKKMVAVSREHKLANKDKINIEDLYGETLMMVKEGDSECNDTIRNDLKKNHPKIHIENTQQFYDLSVFNRCAETGNILLTIECWKDVHPALVTIPVQWDYDIPFGLLYSLNPPNDVLQCVETIKSII